MPMVYINTLYEISRKLASSDMSWNEYLSFPMWPSSSGPTYTPTSMRGRNIYATGLLWGELDICSLSSYFGGWFEVPVAFGFSLISHSSQAEASSTVSPIGCPAMVI
jgi:hypothetical protein